MKPLYKNYTLLTLLLMIMACNLPSKIDYDAEKAQLLQRDIDWAAASKYQEFFQFSEYLDENAVFFSADNEYASGIDSIIAQVEAKSTQQEFEFSWQPTEAILANDVSLGYVKGKFHETFNDTLGNLVTKSGSYVSIWKKEDGNWKCILISSHYHIPKEMTAMNI